MTDPKNQNEIITNDSNNDIYDSEEEEINTSDYDSSNEEVIEYNGKQYDYKWIEREKNEIDKILDEITIETEKFKKNELSESEQQNFLEKRTILIERYEVWKAVKNLYFEDVSSDEEQEEQKENQTNEIISKLDSIISQSYHNPKSKANLNKYVSYISTRGIVDKNNKLYEMKESDRKELAKNFTGLDRILFDRLNEKTGTFQTPTTDLVAKQSLQSVVNAVPFLGNITQLATTNTYISIIDNKNIMLEQSFTADEVKDIVWQNSRELRQNLDIAKSLAIAAIQEKDDEIKNLKKEKKNLKKQGEKELKDRLNDLRSKQGIEKKDLENSISQKEQTLTNIQKEKEDLEAEKTNTLNKLGKLEEAKKELTKKLNASTSLLDQANKDKAQLNLKKAELEKSIRTLAGEKQILLDNLNQSTRTILDYEKSEAETARKLELISNKGRQISNGDSWDLETYKKEYPKLQLINEAQGGVISSNEITLREKEKKIETAEQAAIILDNEKKKLEKVLGEVNAELDNIKIDLNRTNLNMVDKDEEINRLNAKIEKLENEKKELEKDLRDTKIDLESANRQPADKTSQIKALKKSAEKREEEISDLTIEKLELFDEREKAKGEVEKYQNALTRQKNLYEKLADALNAEKAERKAQAEKDRLDFLAVCQERDKIKNSMSPKWMQKLFYRIDWALGTDMEKSVNSFWSKSKSYGRLSLLILVAIFFVYIGSWMLRILVAIGRNIKAMFSKKQDPKEVLTEFLQTAKEAKDQLKKSPEKKEAKPIIEAEEAKEVKASPAESKEEAKPMEISNQKTTENLEEEKPIKEVEENLGEEETEKK